jgi:hypothetical protein
MDEAVSSEFLIERKEGCEMCVFVSVTVAWDVGNQNEWEESQ